MNTQSELRRRRLFAGTCLIAAPLLAGIAAIVAPQLASGTTDRLEAIAAAPGRLDTALVIGMIALALAAFAALGLGHLLREEQPWLGQLGTLLAVTGIVVSGVLVGAMTMASAVAETDVAVAATAWDTATSGATIVVAVAGMVVAGVGALLLAAGLWLAHTAPRVTAAGLALGTIVLAIGVLAASTPWLVVGYAVLFLALAPLGYELIAEPDEAWEHPAHFEGMRPVLG